MDERSASGGVLVAVFPDEATAERAAASARRAGADRLEVGGERAEQASMRSEMREELSNSTAGAGAMGVATKEMGKGMSIAVPVGAVIGAIVFLPLALVSMGDLSAGARVLIVMACGALAGGVVGLVLGGALGARRPAEAMAAQRGVTVTAAPATEAVERAMAELHPLRLDVVNRRGTPLDSRPDEREPDVPTARRLGRNVAADDYEVPPERET
jgi:outer membrane lipoprotein SlyB